MRFLVSLAALLPALSSLNLVGATSSPVANGVARLSRREGDHYTNKALQQRSTATK